MPNRNYTAGRQREYYARDLLRARGYSVVRSAGSKSPVDLVAFNNEEALLIQVKTEGESLVKAVEKLKTFRAPPWVKRQVWHWHKRGEWEVTEVSIFPDKEATT